MWYILADRLSVPSPGRLKKMISATEFVRWCHYLETENERPSLTQSLLALIGLENRRSYVKDPNKYTVKGWFNALFDKVVKTKKPKTREEAAAISKRNVLGGLGMQDIKKKD